MSQIVPKSGHPEKTVEDSRHRLLSTAACALGGLGVICAAIPLVSSLNPNAKTSTLGGPVEVDVSTLKPGQKMTVVWRGKPVWIIRRTPLMLKQLAENNAILRDPNSLEHQQPHVAENSFRSIVPEYLVVIGLCTHLGCVPIYKPGEEVASGFYCPCHGSRFDLAGRVYKDVPASMNLEVPPYHFIKKNVILIGEQVS